MAVILVYKRHVIEMWKLAWYINFYSNIITFLLKLSSFKIKLVVTNWKKMKENPANSDFFTLSCVTFTDIT